MSVKYVCENLNEFQKFGRIFEKQDPKLKKDKEVQKSEEKEGLSVIKKLESNFKKFISSTGGKILKYKEFWSANKKTAESFDDSGNIYKMWNSEYVVGVLMLPDEALSIDNLDTEIDLIDRKREKEGKNDENEKEKEEDEEETEDEETEDEETEEDADKNEWVRPRGTKFLLEKSELSLDFEKDEKKSKSKKKEPKLGFDFGDKDTEKDSNDSLDLDGDSSSSDDLDFSDKDENHEYFVVYNINGDNRDEIFRTDNVKVIKSFKDFYENTFKSTIREQIQKFKAEKEEKKLEQQKKAEEELKKQRKSKFDKFMKESVNDEDSYENLKKKYPNWNWSEAEEISNDDLDAAAIYFDRIANKDLDEAINHEDSYENLKKKYPNWNWSEAEEISNDDLDAAAIYFDRIANKDLDEAINHWDLYAQNLKNKYPGWKKLDNDDNDNEEFDEDYNENDEITEYNYD